MHNLQIKQKGFSLIEMMIAIVMLGLIVGAVISVVLNSQRSKSDSEIMLETQQTARVLVDMIVEDIRMAGYGANAVAGHRPINYAGPFDLILSANLAPYPDTIDGHGTPRALNPLVNPLPGGSASPLYSGGSGFTDGAECIRYTFDSNNNGAIAVDDRGDDLEETLSPRNTRLYCLVRQVFGYDSAANSNGGTSLPVGLARCSFPAAPVGQPAIRPLFVYYYYDAATNTEKVWGDTDNDNMVSSAAEIAAITPLSSSLLPKITKIGVYVTTEARRPNSKNIVQVVTLNTVVSLSRNYPVLEGKTISGFVYSDNDSSRTMGAGEDGIEGIKVTNRTDGQTTVTDVTGSYSFSVAPQRHIIEITVPPIHCGDTKGYRIVPPAKADSLVDATSSNKTLDFPLVPYIPRSVSGIVFKDDNADGLKDAGELGLGGCTVYLKSTGQSYLTGSDGSYCLATAPLPDTAICIPVVADPEYVPTVPATAKAGVSSSGNVTQNFGFRPGGTAHIRGKVFRDAAPIGSYDNEAGIGGVRISVYKGLDPTTEIYVKDCFTAADGTFGVDVLETDAANPYTIVETDSAGWMSTTPNRIAVYRPSPNNTSRALQTGDTTIVYTFGDLQMQTVYFQASNVLCMTDNDFYEYEGSAASHYYDCDIVLGTKYINSTTGNLRGWFSKRYKIDGTQETNVDYIFDSLVGPYTYEKTTSLVNANVIAIASDTMDDYGSKSGTRNISNYRSRRDLVVGLDNTGATTPSYNLIVWPTINDDSATTTSRGRAQMAANIPTTPNFLLTAVDPTYKVNTISLANFGNDGFPDIAAGYTSAYSQGGFVLWINTPYTSYTGNWSNKQVRSFPTPPADQVFANLGGEVMALASGLLLNSDTKQDLVVGLQKGKYVGEIQVYEGQGATPWFVKRRTFLQDNVNGDVVALAVADIDTNGRNDIVAAVRTDSLCGELQVWLQNTDGSFGKIDGNPSFVAELKDKNGLDIGEPTSMAVSRMNWISGSLTSHIVVGLRSGLSGGRYYGKTLVFDCSKGVLPEEGTDPSLGLRDGDVATVGIGDFNKDGHMDISAAEKTEEGKGNLIIYFPKY